MKWLAFASIILVIVTTGCNKCDPTNTIGGVVVEDAVVRIINGPIDPRLVRSNSELTQDVQVRLDGETSYQSVDFSEYSVISLPTVAGCSSGYDRVVELNESDQTVKYTITITECETCEGQIRIDNWVLIPAVPPNYEPIFEIK